MQWKWLCGAECIFFKHFTRFHLFLLSWSSSFKRKKMLLKASLFSLKILILCMNLACYMLWFGCSCYACNNMVSAINLSWLLQLSLWPVFVALLLINYYYSSFPLLPSANSFKTKSILVYFPLSFFSFYFFLLWWWWT